MNKQAKDWALEEGLTNSPDLSTQPVHRTLPRLKTCPGNEGPGASGGERPSFVGVPKEPAPRRGRQGGRRVFSQKRGVSSSGAEA